MPFRILITLGVFGLCAVGFFSYYGSPKYTEVGYRPSQPINYSHKLHAGDLGMDCRYCHFAVEKSSFAGVPPTQVCMNCHTLQGTDKPNLAPVRESFESNKPIEWVRVHKVADYAFFNHSMHMRAGVGCQSCHGEVNKMEKVQVVQPLSMGWCLDCHRNPDQHLRDLTVTKLTDMNWTPPADQAERVQKIKKEKNLNPPEDCSGCHR